MPADRMNREEFSRKVAPLDADDLRKTLWTLYWRGTDTLRVVLDRIAGHSALGGSEQKFVAARLALRRDDVGTARKLVAQCLHKVPGHAEFRDFAAEIGV